MEMTQKLITQKYYLFTLLIDDKSYIKDYDVGLTFKFIKYKFYSNLQSFCY